MDSDGRLTSFHLVLALVYQRARVLLSRYAYAIEETKYIKRYCRGINNPQYRKFYIINLVCECHCKLCISNPNLVTPCIDFLFK